jgi:hypothetical protein
VRVEIEDGDRLRAVGQASQVAQAGGQIGVVEGADGKGDGSRRDAVVALDGGRRPQRLEIGVVVGALVAVAAPGRQQAELLAVAQHAGRLAGGAGGRGDVHVTIVQP